MNQKAIALTLKGRVQGVGFRPFVYRLASEHSISGWVRNVVGRVEIHAEGTPEKLVNFRRALIEDSPAFSAPVIECEYPATSGTASGFSILVSQHQGDAEIYSPPDQYLCAGCEAELNDVANRRYSYPFINCTECGPRYTIIAGMPYDRENTCMSSFPLCTPCYEEYCAPENRRYHAEPNTCATCGPHLSYFEGKVKVHGDSTLALEKAACALGRGKIIAVKGVGGYHLVCDAANNVAVAQLRRRKQRPHKPLALMVPARGNDCLDAVRELVELETREVEKDLLSQSRPIMLLKKMSSAPVCSQVAPGLDELGVMLPPSPLHALLIEKFGKAIVATSGNISGEPVLTNDAEARIRLGKITDGWLLHNREIVRPADDSVKRPIAGRPRVLRLGRGISPLEYDLKIRLRRPVIAVGGHLKNTVALAWGNRVVVSPHIGELSSKRGYQVFEQVVSDLQYLYQVTAEAVICDAHPQYASSRWAARQELPVYSIQHHRAHASSLAGDSKLMGQYFGKRGLIFTWDGAGYGDDDKLWGGEVFLGMPAQWQRVASFRNFWITGGDRVSQEPWRSAAALHWQLGEKFEENEKERLLYSAWQKEFNSIETSAVGRLFDAAASMTGIVQTSSHEGEAPMCLEAAAEDVESNDYLPFHEVEGLLRIDWEPLFYAMKDETHPVQYRAGYFHVLLANTVARLARSFQDNGDFDYVGLSGGVFQNCRLSELIVRQLEEVGIPCFLPTNIPTNDGGISYGQVIEFAAGHAKTK